MVSAFTSDSKSYQLLLVLISQPSLDDLSLQLLNDFKDLI